MVLRVTRLKGDVVVPLGEQPEDAGVDIPIPDDHELFDFRCYPAPHEKGSDPNFVTWRWVATLTQRVAT